MKRAVIDVETFYDKDVSVVNLGVPNYVKAADAYVIGVYVEGEADVQCGTLKEMADLCANLSADPTVQPVAANSNFDQAFFEKYWPAFKQPWHCVLDHSAFHQFPRNLIGLTEAVLGEKIDKTTRTEMKGVHYEDLPRDKQLAVEEYCANDCVKEYECMVRMPSMSPLEEKVAAHTRLINRRGVQINTNLVDEDKTKLGAMRFEAFKSIPWHNDSPPLSYQALTRYCSTRSIPVPKSLAKTDEECSDLMTDSPELKSIIDQMRRFRRANTMLKKIETLQERVTEDGILPLDILYCGAPHTRRWSSKGFNVQNLDKEPLKVTADGQTVWTRNWLVPRAGKIFYIADFAQIEPRCLNWLAQSDEMLAAMRAGYSIYEAFAIQAEGWKGQPGTIKEELGKKRYTLLKNRVLGLGYGMGSSKFEDYVRTNGGEISPEEAKRIVTDFRTRNPKIVGMWKRYDNLIATAGKDKARHLAMELPTGDLLQYFNVRASSGDYQGYITKCDFGHQSKQPRLWGGTLTENVTQRMARDILATAVVNLEEAGLPVAWTVHDEVILELDDDASKDEARREADRILTTPPDWCPDLPLGIEGSYAGAYTK